MVRQTPPFDAAQTERHDNNPVLEQLLRSVTYAMECSTAVFYELDGSMLRPLVEVEPIAPAEDTEVTALWPTPQTAEMLTVNDARVTADWTIPSLGFESPVCFAAAVPIWNAQEKLKGALLIADEAPRAGLSGAQTYVLQTHARQLGFWHASDPDRTRDPERLRLLESVVVTAKESVLITEAEPLDEPGPRIVYCNAAFTRTTGYAEPDVIGRSPRLLQNADTERGPLDRLRAALEAADSAEIEVLNSRKDGHQYWVELSVVPVADEHGKATHYVSVQRDVSERRRRESIGNNTRIIQAENLVDSAQQLAPGSDQRAFRRDDLTHLWTRAFFIDQLQKTIDRSTAGGTVDGSAPRAYLLFLDLDRLKPVNDTFGHRAGDQVLMEVARRLENCVRASDTIARLGGDEFVVLMQSADSEAAASQLANRIGYRLQAAYRFKSQDIFISCSIGVVAIDARYTRAEDVIRDADIAMYSAKNQGPGECVMFDAALRSAMADKLTLEHELQRALLEDQLTLVYQPIYDPLSQRLQGIEALVRWPHPRHGMLEPADFLPAAHAMDAMSGLGAHVLRRACAQFSGWQRQSGHPKLWLSVNVSGPELGHPEFIERLESALQATHLTPDRLQLEVSERVFSHNPEAIGHAVHAVRSLGVRVVLDDFGAETASLDSIERYPLDGLKIDARYMQRMLQSERSRTIVANLIQLGRALEIPVTAEGIETLSQHQHITSMRCALAQGYHLARPLAPDALEQLLLAT